MQQESDTLKREYKWILQDEVPSQIDRLYHLLVDCSRRFPLRNTSRENIVKPEKFLLNVSSGTSPVEGVKCIVTLLGDNICEADIQLRLHKHHGQIYKSNIYPDNPWKLQQLQDAGNHLSAAIELLSNKRGQPFFSKQELIMLLNDVMNYLTTGRHCLIMPRKKTIQELQNSRNMKTLNPLLPQDMAISFYIQSHKLCFAVYHILTSHGSQKFEVLQGECLVPWLNEALAMFTVAMHQCQQMKDKVSVFSQYTDIFCDPTSLILPPSIRANNHRPTTRSLPNQQKRLGVTSSTTSPTTTSTPATNGNRTTSALTQLTSQIKKVSFF